MSVTKKKVIVRLTPGRTEDLGPSGSWTGWAASGSAWSDQALEVGGLCSTFWPQILKIFYKFLALLKQKILK